MGIVVRKLIDKIEMLSCIEVIRELYPSLNEEEYMRQLDEMLPHNYFQVGAFKGDECIGISGVWIGNKLWCGKYLEIKGFHSQNVSVVSKETVPILADQIIKHK